MWLLRYFMIFPYIISYGRYRPGSGSTHGSSNGSEMQACLDSILCGEGSTHNAQKLLTEVSNCLDHFGLENVGEMGHGSHGSKVCSWKSGLQRIALFELDCTPPLKPGEYRRPSELTAQWISVLYVITRVVRVVRVIEFALKFFDHSCDHCDPQWLHLPNCCRLPGFCSPTASTLPCPTVSPPIAWPICSGQCLDQKQQLCRYKNSSRLFDLKNHRSSSNTRFFGMFFIGTVGL